MRRLRAFAKINVDLRVLAKRPDGYHELRTIFQTISLADEMDVVHEPASAISIAIESEDTLNIPVEQNLIARAARLVFQETQCGGRVQFTLRKRIPMGAGLGGGSSDAAAVLMGLPSLIGRNIAGARLHEMAAALGSDVPFFLYGGTAVGMGRGEELYPLPDLPALPGLLIAPDIHVSTAEAYLAVSGTLAQSSPDMKRAEFGQLAWTEQLALARNDFEAPVFAMYPELGVIRQALEDAGSVIARMTGSGSALFGLFRDADGVEQARKAMEGYRAIPFSLVGRDEYGRTILRSGVN